jgi:hypothetical protein
VFGFVQDINSGYIQANMSNAGNYYVSQFATRIHLDSAIGEINFLTAASGTAGNAVSLIPRMKITNGGTLEVGTRSDATEATANLRLNNTNFGGFHFLDGTAYYIGQNSNFRSLRMYSGGASGTGVNLAVGATSWGTYSDERMKDIIEPITNSLDKINTLRTVIGKYKTDEADKRRVFLMAQDVQAVLPEAVYDDMSEDKILSLQYTDIIPLLVASVKELSAKVAALEAQQ